MTAQHPLQIALSAAVPLHIAELQQQGGPTDWDIEEARDFSGELASRGDVLLFGSKKRGEAAMLFNKLARSLAVVAFCPGGVKVFGQHFEAKVPPPKGGEMP